MRKNLITSSFPHRDDPHQETTIFWGGRMIFWGNHRNMIGEFPISMSVYPRVTMKVYGNGKLSHNPWNITVLLMGRLAINL